MHPVLSEVQSIWITAADLRKRLHAFPRPQEVIDQMVQARDLIALTEDFFTLPKRMEDSPDPYEQIANHLYAPSYVSFEWALAYHRMIPEAVFSVTNVTTNPSKRFQTPFCWFHYTFLYPQAYAVGLEHHENSIGGFLMATPEKALADLIHFRSDDLTVDELVVDLLESRRIDDTDLKKLDKNLLRRIAQHYQSPAVTNLVHALDRIF